MMTSTGQVFLPKEDCIGRVLSERGAGSLDDVSRLADLDWAETLSTVDRLSRAGLIVPRRVGFDYRVSLEGNA